MVQDRKRQSMPYMKTPLIITLKNLLTNRTVLKSSTCRLTVLAGALVVANYQATAQTDNFNDGNDTSPVAWTHYDAISTIFAAPAQDTWSFPGGTSYRLQANPSPAPGSTGPARVSSFPTNIYTDFYESVDILSFSNTYSQAIGLLARAGNFGTAGAPTTRGYMFIYVNGAVSAGLDNFIAIARLQNDAQTRGIHGSSGATAEFHGVTLDPAKQYRFAFIGKGTHLEGRIYQLPDVTTPIAVVSGNTAGDAIQHTNGQSGVFAFNAADAGGTAYAGPVDVVFDNYVATTDCPTTSFADDFNDGNDTTPAPAWIREDPIAEAGVPAPCYTGGTFTFPGGGYKLFSPVPCVTAAGGPRVSALRGDRIWSDFYISVDVLSWDDTVHQLFGIAARINTPGPGSTAGYLFTWEDGSGTLPNATGGDFDLLRIQAEGATDAHQMEGDVPGQNSGMHLTNGNAYRFVYIGKGFNFEARVYDVADLSAPVKTIFGVDTLAMFPNGLVGVIVADHPADSPYHACTATFDNFYVAAAEPRLSMDASSGTAVLSWSASLDCIWVLESSPTLGPGSVWTEITADQVTFSAGQKSHQDIGTMASNQTTFFRLRKL
jgi:hypothetical protein